MDRACADGAGPGADAARPAAGAADAGVDAAEAEERSLLRAARAGDRQAFTRLVEPLMQPAFQFAARLLGDRDLGEDVAQEALLKAYSSLASFRGEARFRSWLFRIVHNTCTDALRRQARRRETPWAPVAEAGGLEDALSGVADPAPGPEDAVLDRMGRAEILRAVAALPADQRAVVLLRDVHDLSYGEIAAVTGQRLGTIKSRLHRARAALRAALAEGHGGGSAPGALGQGPREPDAAVGVQTGAATRTRRSPQEAE